MKRILPYLLVPALAACQSSGTPARGVEGTIAPLATLGLETSVPSEQVAEQMGLAFQVRQQGRLVHSVAAGGPAASAGIEAGDVLLRLDGVTLYSADDIADILSIHEPGAMLSAEIVKAGTAEPDERNITLGTGAARPGESMRWQYASLAQLPAALESARAENKKVLVGLSGAET